MNKILTKFVSVITAASMSVFVSLQGIQSITDEIRAHAAEIVYGDADNSGSVDSFDLTLIRMEAASPGSTQCDKTAADVNGDGVVNNSDVREVQQYLLGTRNSFTVIDRNLVPVPETAIVSKDQPAETSMTKEMARKADELQDAVSIYNYVYNNIRSEFYNGSRKGAIGTFEQGSGNDLDISSLLIAMLRYRGYDANYVTSLAGFTEEQLLKWTKTDDIKVAEKIYASQNLTLYFCDYNYVQVESEGKTYFLDACMKEYEKQETIYDQIDAAYSFTDAEAIIENNDLTLFEADMDEAAASIETIQDMDAPVYTYKIVPQTFSSLSEEDPHVIDIEPTSYSIIPDEKYDWITIAFNNNRKVSYHSAELYRKNVIVTYEVSEDSEELAEFLIADTSSIFTLPSEALGQPFSVTPVVYVDGERVLEGPSLKIGQKQNLYIVNESNGNRIEGTEELNAGEMCSIIFDTGSISANELAEAYNTSLNNTSKINQRDNLTVDMTSNNGLDESNVYTADYLGSILRFSGVLYFAQMDKNTQYLSEKENINIENTLRFCIVGFTPEVFTGGTMDTRQKDGIQKQGRYFFDVLSNAVQPVSKESDDVSLRAFNCARGFISSELESAVIEELLNVNSTSTVAIFKYAQENNIPIVKLSATSETKVSDLDISSEDASRLQSEIDKGNSIIMPRSAVTIDDWSGIGYIIVSDGGNTQEFMISGGLKGGSSGIPVALCALVNIAIDMAWFAEAFAALCAPTSWFCLIGAAILIAVLYVNILQTIERNFDYYIYGDEKAGEAVKKDAFWNVVTFGVFKGGGAAINKIAGARNAAKYGSSTINALKEAGFTTKEINAQIKTFRELGMTQQTIDALLKNPKCMYLGNDILSFLGKQGGNQRLLAELVIGNGDDFTKALLNSNYLDDFCNIIWKNGSGYARIFGTYADDSIACVKNYGDDAIEAINKYGDDAINAFELYGDDAAKGLKNGLTPDEIATAQTFVQSKPSSAKLGKNIIASGRAKPAYDCAAHHIVAGSSPKAADARAILQKYSIDINCAENGVFLPTDKSILSGIYHPSMHTTVYYDEVNNLMNGVQSREEALEMLNYIRECLEQGTFPT